MVSRFIIEFRYRVPVVKYLKLRRTLHGSNIFYTNGHWVMLFSQLQTQEQAHSADNEKLTFTGISGCLIATSKVNSKISVRN